MGAQSLESVFRKHKETLAGKKRRGEATGGISVRTCEDKKQLPPGGKARPFASEFAWRAGSWGEQRRKAGDMGGICTFFFALSTSAIGA